MSVEGAPGDEARAEYERALSAYEAVRFGRGARSVEWAAARRLDVARSAYFRRSPGRAPQSDPPPTRWRWPRLRLRAPALDSSRVLAVLLEVVPPLALTVGITLPLAYFFMVAKPDPRSASPDLTYAPPTARSGSAPALRFRPEPASVVSRSLEVEFTSDVALLSVGVRMIPDPGVTCEARLETGQGGRIRCLGPLPGGQDFVAHVLVTSRYGGVTGRTEYAFRTREKLDRLVGVKWFSEFEDPTAEPLACAAASIRIVNAYTSGRDPMSATQILRLGQQFNRSRDPGLDPAAIGTMLKRLDPSNNYHYYVYASREEATKAAVYWLLRSGKPVVTITLAGQHAPVLIGYTGQFGARDDDAADRISGVIMMDPQRGDLDPRTARFRLDKDRSADYQTGREINLLEWYRDEWWFGFPYAPGIQMPDGTTLNIDRNDGAYPLPHWSGNFVIIVDDGDANQPSDRMGRRAPG